MRYSESDEFKLWVPRYPMAASGGGGAFKAPMPESDEFKLWVSDIFDGCRRRCSDI